MWPFEWCFHFYSHSERQRTLVKCIKYVTWRNGSGNDNTHCRSLGRKIIGQNSLTLWKPRILEFSGQGGTFWGRELLLDLTANHQNYILGCLHTSTGAWEDCLHGRYLHLHSAYQPKYFLPLWKYPSLVSLKPLYSQYTQLRDTGGVTGSPAALDF